MSDKRPIFGIAAQLMPQLSDALVAATELATELAAPVKSTTCSSRSAAARVPCSGEHVVIDGVWKHQSADGSLVWTDPRVPAGPDPIEWIDRQGDVWEESPVDHQMLRLARFANGDVVNEGHYQPKDEIDRQWGELVQTTDAPITLENVAEWQVDDEEGGTGEVDLTDRDAEVRHIMEMNRQRVSDMVKNPEPIMRSEFDAFTSEQKKLVEAAAELENISAMVKEAVLDLRNAARTGDVADAYARAYFLRRELGRVVAGLGVGVPRTLAAVEAEYRELTEG